MFAAWGWLSLEINGVSLLPWLGLACLGLAQHSRGEETLSAFTLTGAADVFFTHKAKVDSRAGPGHIMCTRDENYSVKVECA